MIKTQLEGIAHQLKGAVKEGLGKIVGDAKLAADGNEERAQGAAQVSAGSTGEQAFGVDQDRIMGIAHQLKGSLKAAVGAATGNTELEQRGAAERAAGKAQNAVGSARDASIEAAGTVDSAHGMPPE